MFSCRRLLTKYCLFLHTISCFVLLAGAQNFWPSAVPLGAKAPHFNVWLPMPLTDIPDLNRFPQPWGLKNTFGNAGLIRVDGETYVWLAPYPVPAANMTGLALTPTSTKFSAQAMGMDMNITFLSPIELDDLARQSYPFTYIYIDLASNDGQAHDVQVYMDISGEWLSGHPDNTIKYNTTGPVDSSQIVYHQASRSSPESFAEVNGTAEDSTLFLGMAYDSSVTYSIDSYTNSRDGFVKNKSLTNKAASQESAINAEFPVFALSKDLGSIQSTSEPIVFALGLSRDPVVEVKLPNKDTETRYPYYKTKYNGAADGISDFIADFSDARSRANALDNRILSSSHDISSDLADLTSLTTRSIMASMDITYGSDPNDIMIFVKKMGDQNPDSTTAGRMNPVETLYAAWPSIMYLNATYGGYILEPLLKYQDANSSYSEPDLGNEYPILSEGDSSNYPLAIEESGNLLLMIWAHARFSGDTRIISTYYDLLKTWADYLQDRTLTPSGFNSADNFDGSYNQTNLALKGILGIRAMVELARIHGDNDAADAYNSKAEDLIAQWKTLSGSSSGHMTAVYGQGSWGLMYNMYPDKWLGLNMLEDSIYKSQTTYYEQQVPKQYGLAYDSQKPEDGKSHWTLFTAATASDDAVRDRMIHSVYTRANYNWTSGLFPTSYNVNSGVSQGGECSPAFGALFAPMALNLHPYFESLPKSNKTKSSHVNAGAIAGGVIGGVAVLAILVLAVLFWRRRKSKVVQQIDDKVSTSDHFVDPYAFVYAPVVAHGSDRGSTAPDTPPWGSISKHGLDQPQPQLYPPTGSSLQSPPISSNGASGDELRDEVERLRREMDEVRAAGNVYEAPPQYGASQHGG